MSYLINISRETYIPTKMVKLKKYKHKKCNWITKGIIKSIKYRDNLYKKLKLTSHDSPNFNIAKTNLLCYNRILKKYEIGQKKVIFHHVLVCTKMTLKTWSTIGNLINSSNKKEYPDFFYNNDSKTYDKIEIANNFNQYFTNIGSKLAEEISSYTNKHYSDFLINKTNSRFQFVKVNVQSVSMVIDNLPNKSISGHDNLSFKIIKLYLKKLISAPLTIIINQMFNTGIFPESLEIAKVKPLFKKNDHHTISNYRPISLLPSISKVFEKIIYHQT